MWKGNVGKSAVATPKEAPGRLEGNQVGPSKEEVDGWKPYKDTQQKIAELNNVQNVPPSASKVEHTFTDDLMVFNDKALQQAAGPLPLKRPSNNPFSPQYVDSNALSQSTKNARTDTPSLTEGGNSLSLSDIPITHKPYEPTISEKAGKLATQAQTAVTEAKDAFIKSRVDAARVQQGNAASTAPRPLLERGKAKRNLNENGDLLEASIQGQSGRSPRIGSALNNNKFTIAGTTALGVGATVALTNSGANTGASPVSQQIPASTTSQFNSDEAAALARQYLALERVPLAATTPSLIPDAAFLPVTQSATQAATQPATQNVSFLPAAQSGTIAPASDEISRFDALLGAGKNI